MVCFFRIGDPLEPQPLSYWILTTQYLLNDPHVWFVAGFGPSFTYLVVPNGNPSPLPFSREHLENVYAMLISWILQRITSSHSKDLHEINVSTDFQWSMQDLGYLVNITNFEFLCRKLNFVHVGIVQNFSFFIKSARRFRKTISTLESQHVVCIPGIMRSMTVPIWIWELWMMWREMHGCQTWTIR